jgi:hypothetical protein
MLKPASSSSLDVNLQWEAELMVSVLLNELGTPVRLSRAL